MHKLSNLKFIAIVEHINTKQNNREGNMLRNETDGDEKILISVCLLPNPPVSFLTLILSLPSCFFYLSLNKSFELIS